jgi:ferredoxin
MRTIILQGTPIITSLSNHHYECRSGFCGQCKCKIIDGDIRYLQQPIAHLDSGEILPCITIAVTDVVLET